MEKRQRKIYSCIYFITISVFTVFYVQAGVADNNAYSNKCGLLQGVSGRRSETTDILECWNDDSVYCGKQSDVSYSFIYNKTACRGIYTAKQADSYFCPGYIQNASEHICNTCAVEKGQAACTKKA
jgi:hypothetical protein